MSQAPIIYAPAAAIEFNTDGTNADLERYADTWNDFFLQFDFLNIPAGQTQSRPWQVQNDYFYYMKFLTVESSKDEDDVPYEFNLKIENTGRSLSFMNVPIRRALIAGTAENPFYFPRDIVFKPTANLAVTVTNLDIVTQSVYVMIAGRLKHI